MFSYGDLMQLGHRAHKLATDDADVLASYGINDAFRDNLEEKLQQVKDFPEDVEQEYGAVAENETKLKRADETKVGIRTMMVLVKQLYKEGSGKWTRFGTADMSKMNDLQLIKCGFRVVRVAQSLLTTLEPFGVTQAMIDALEITVKAYDKAYDDQQDALLLRKEFTIDRILLANELYGLIAKVCDYGKDYWSSRDSFKHSLYVIYETPPSKRAKAKKKAAEKEKPE